MITPDTIKTSIGKYLLADGMDIIVDLKNSKGCWLVDQRNGKRYFDCFSMFASMAIGFNHDKMLLIKEELGSLAVQKPSNSDAYSAAMAEFVETFANHAMPDYLPHAFFIEGGALAVENALKTAFDWKVRRNFSRGAKKEIGSQIIHFKQAFHGRSGYTLSLTNTTDPRKTCYFPKFTWPRIINPTNQFPPDGRHLAEVKDLEDQAFTQIHKAIQTNGDDIAGLIIEPIQGEGGDNHFRNEFFTELRKICDENSILFIMDEVQTGVGLTGKFWAHEHFDVTPDIISFGKKTQVCGILASKRIDEVKNNVFKEPSRINSTFGGNLIDMVRCSALLKIIDQENLVDNAKSRGTELLCGLEELSRSFPHRVNNARGKGLMCAIDLKNDEARNRFVKQLIENGLLVVGCGIKSVRFRPHLTITEQEVQEVLDILENTLKKK